MVSTKKICTDYSYYNGETSLSSGWYVLSGNHTYEERPQCHGDVKFILLDGSNTEFQKGIHIDNPQHLTIYAQDAGSGKLRCTGDDGSIANGDAANGGNNEVVGGHLIIHGGTIYAKPSHNNAAGIGGGDGESGMQSITIWDGKIEAYGQDGGAGIGKGYNNAVNIDITIYGGSITANGGDKGAGIGGGQECGTGRVRIFGGTITANGGKYAAGIGGGNYNQNGKIYIYGGNVTAKGGDGGAGIGAGEYNNGGFIEIHGGTVKAYGGYETPLIGSDVGGAAGIGGGVGKIEVPYYGYGEGGQVDICGGYVETSTAADGIGQTNYVTLGLVSVEEIMLITPALQTSTAASLKSSSNPVMPINASAQGSMVVLMVRTSSLFLITIWCSKKAMNPLRVTIALHTVS